MNVLVTAGNTQAPLDRVRCVTNVFAGRTGAQIAARAFDRGHRVTLLTSHPEVLDALPAARPRREPDWEVVRYRTFDDLADLMAAHVAGGGYDVLVHSAAVSDYLVAGVFTRDGTDFADVAAGKVKSTHPELWVKMTPAPKLVDRVRADWGFCGVLVKFKLEVGPTEAELLDTAERSRTHSGADWMCANTFEGMHDWAVIGDGPGRYTRVPRAELADRLLDAAGVRHQQHANHRGATRAGPGGLKRVVILGGGFGGVYTSRRLGPRVKGRTAEVTLVSRDNYFVMTPLLFEAASGVIEFRHAVNPIRPLVCCTDFVNATVERVDLAGREVHARSRAGDVYRLPYDHLVLALGGVTNTARTPGGEHALTFKTVRDAVAIRNRVIEAFERADAEPDPVRQRAALTIVVIGGGLVGCELVGELTEFTAHLLRSYPRLQKYGVRLVQLQSGPRLLPEMTDGLAAYTERTFRRRGVEVRTGTGARAIDPGSVTLTTGEVVEAATVVLAAGLAPNPVVAALDLPKDRTGRVTTDACMRVPGHDGLWAVGDCAAIPDPAGNPYPTLAQHALREGKLLADNIAAVLAGEEPRPFVYRNRGTMAALGHRRGIANLMGLKVWGFPAWWVWRTYYLLQMPRWERRLRIMADWTVGLLFRPDAAKIDLSPDPVAPAAEPEDAGAEAVSA